MIDTLKYNSAKTNSATFYKYCKLAIDQLIEEHGISNQKAGTLERLLLKLEGHRVSFTKGDYRFQTKRVSCEVLAAEMRLTKRYVRMLLRILETAGIITIRRRRVGRFMNLWNAFEFTGFMEWLTRYAQSRCNPVPPKEESNLRLPFTKIAFPTSDISSFDHRHRFWKLVANEALPQGAQLPCLAKLSAKFRLNLRQHGVFHDDASVIARWKGFVKRGIEFQNGPRLVR